ncbi:MAG: N-acetylmuramoyl-L-alanine amidase LytC [Candidatus Dichloromethanomonas elyunquensis]|nr:MAG: N-acetylmuramoyl-L-alanine amidase LytC [Candidatus Dichloromethanomonas elyunquensis]
MKKLLLVLAVFFAFLFNTPFPASASPLVYATDRLSGQDRIETSLSISQKGWSSAQTVILCEYADYPDSIAAAPFAVSQDAPILLTGGETLDPRVISELQRLKPQKIILLGGTGCLTPSIEKEVERYTLSWERIGGLDRYETSVLLAGRLTSDSLIIANGDNFPDALSAASYAGIHRIPIVLTSKTLPSSVADYCETNHPEHIMVIGGERAVPTESLSQNHLAIETRLGGQDRYETNSQIVAYMKNSAPADDLFLASGLNFPDAIAGTVLASKLKAPLLLTEKEDIPPAIYTIMREHMKVEPAIATVKFGKGKITASGGLNLRDTPSASGKALQVIPQGTTIEITSKQGQWYQTSYHDKTGWISAEFVTITQTYKQGKITASGGLNLRETASVSSDILATIPQGTTIPITGDQNQWYKTAYQGTPGWVSKEFVTILSEESSRSSPETVDLSANGRVYILGGFGVVSENTENIIEGKAVSTYQDNQREFPSLPEKLTGAATYDPAKEVLLDPFEGISSSLKGKKIMIDPGHGGPDTGAIGPNDTYEKNNNLAIAVYLKDILTEAGAIVSMTRTKDISPAPEYTETADLEARVNMANGTNPDLFISIHNNARSNSETTGTATYYSSQNPRADVSAKLAEVMENTVTATLNTNKEGVRKADFYVLAYTKMPSVLVEVAYISNPYEEARLQNPVFQKNVATAVFHGINTFYTP